MVEKTHQPLSAGPSLPAACCSEAPFYPLYRVRHNVPPYRLSRLAEGTALAEAQVGKEPRRYTCIVVRQTPNAPPFYLTAVAAEELLEWADVPRSKANYMADYQRALSDRHKAIAEYFRTSRYNVTPGAVIVAIDEDYVDISSNGAVATIQIHEDTRDFDIRLSELFGQLTTRLTDEELTSAQVQFSTYGDEDEDDAEDDELDEEDVEDVAAKPVSYLATLAEELRLALEDFDKLTDDRKKALRDFIDGRSKPGLIIDGQHRVFGAKSVSEFRVDLPVVLMPGLSHAEQVFHFYVLNSTAKPLKNTELRRIVSTSLTDAEIQDLYDRFDQAGVEAEEARWTFQLNTREDSVFRGLVDFGFGQPGEIIPENVADQLVRRFVKMSKKKYATLINPVRAKWEDTAFRLELFFEFWNSIATAATMEETWQAARTAAQDGTQHQLFYKVGLINLQRFVLDKLAEAAMFQEAEGGAFSDRDRLRDQVRIILTNLPGEFFEREWKLKQIDTRQGNEDFYAAMESTYKNKGKVDGRIRLFKG